MKKVTVLLMLALLITVFAGCELPDSGLPNPAQPTVPTVPTKAVVGLPIDKQAAIQIALDHAKVTNDAVQHLHARQDTDDGIVHYDVDFRHGDYYYAYEISEKTGEILKLETEFDRTQLPQTQISKEEAEAIVLEHAGLTKDLVKFLSVEFDSEDHRYEVEFAKDGVEYTYEICAEFGKILDIDIDWDD